MAATELVKELEGVFESHGMSQPRWWPNQDADRNKYQRWLDRATAETLKLRGHKEPRQFSLHDLATLHASAWCYYIHLQQAWHYHRVGQSDITPGQAIGLCVKIRNSLQKCHQYLRQLGLSPKNVSPDDEDYLVK